jgi:hypothetical protein
MAKQIPVPYSGANIPGVTGGTVTTTGANPFSGQVSQNPMTTTVTNTTSAGTPFQSQAQQRGPANQGQVPFYSALPTYYPGSTVANLSPEQIAAQQGVTDTANRQQGQITDYVSQFLNRGTTPGVQTDARLDDALGFALGGALEEGNPYLQNMIDTATRPLTENFTQNVLPTLGSAAQRAGAFGGSRQGIVEGLAAGETAKAIGDVSSGLSYDAYNRALQLMETGIGAGVSMRGQDVQDRATTVNEQLARDQLLPSMLNLEYMPQQMLDAVGIDKRAYDQQLIDADIARHNFGQNIDAERLAQYAAILSGQTTGGIMAGGGSTTTTKTPNASSLQNALGGAASGAALGSMLFDNGGIWGAVLGGLAGLLD